MVFIWILCETIELGVRGVELVWSAASWFIWGTTKDHTAEQLRILSTKITELQEEVRQIKK